MRKREAQKIRLVSLIGAAINKQFTIHNFEDSVQIKSLESSKKDLMAFLREIGSSEYLLEIAKNELCKFYTAEECHAICGALTHYGCQQKFGKRLVHEQPGTLQYAQIIIKCS